MQSRLLLSILAILLACGTLDSPGGARLLGRAAAHPADGAGRGAEDVSGACRAFASSRSPPSRSWPAPWRPASTNTGGCSSSRCGTTPSRTRSSWARSGCWKTPTTTAASRRARSSPTSSPGRRPRSAGTAACSSARRRTSSISRTPTATARPTSAAWSSPASAAPTCRGCSTVSSGGSTIAFTAPRAAPGAEVRRPDRPKDKPLVLRGRDFAFDPRTLDLQPTSGGAQHGMSFDDWGRKFVCSNSDHIQLVMFEDRYLARNPYLAAPSPRREHRRRRPAGRGVSHQPRRAVADRAHAAARRRRGAGPDRRGRPRGRLLHRRDRRDDLPRRRLSAGVRRARRSSATWAATSSIARCSKPTASAEGSPRGRRAASSSPRPTSGSGPRSSPTRPTARCTSSTCTAR